MLDSFKVHKYTLKSGDFNLIAHELVEPLAVFFLCDWALHAIQEQSPRVDVHFPFLLWSESPKSTSRRAGPSGLGLALLVGLGTIHSLVKGAICVILDRFVIQRGIT